MQASSSLRSNGLLSLGTKWLVWRESPITLQSLSLFPPRDPLTNPPGNLTTPGRKEAENQRSRHFCEDERELEAGRKRRKTVLDRGLAALQRPTLHISLSPEVPGGGVGRCLPVMTPLTQGLRSGKGGAVTSQGRKRGLTTPPDSPSTPWKAERRWLIGAASPQTTWDPCLPHPGPDPVCKGKVSLTESFQSLKNLPIYGN